MSHTHAGTRAAGGWLTVASFLLVAVLILHGPIAADLGTQMMNIAAAATRWAVIHWIAAAALSFFAVAGLVVLVAGSRLTQEWWTMSAWAVLSIGALWTVTTAVAEVTVVADAAASGDTARFEAWWAFAEGRAAGFTFFALAVAVIAGNEARLSDGLTPAWAAWAAVVAGIASFVGWALGVWLGIGVGNLLWVASSLAMSLWTLWFGFALTRSPQPSGSP